MSRDREKWNLGRASMIWSDSPVARLAASSSGEIDATASALELPGASGARLVACVSRLSTAVQSTLRMKASIVCGCVCAELLLICVFVHVEREQRSCV